MYFRCCRKARPFALPIAPIAVCNAFILIFELKANWGKRSIAHQAEEFHREVHDRWTHLFAYPAYPEFASGYSNRTPSERHRVRNVPAVGTAAPSALLAGLSQGPRTGVQASRAQNAAARGCRCHRFALASRAQPSGVANDRSTMLDSDLALLP